MPDEEIQRADDHQNAGQHHYGDHPRPLDVDDGLVGIDRLDRPADAETELGKCQAGTVDGMEGEILQYK